MKIRAVSHIKHDGKVIEPGRTIDVPAEKAKALIRAGVAEEVKKETPKEEEGKK